ncbi:hypothetical protein [Dyella sp.]|uniref:hypothetical protein n=1 Tax=Dyella sp. TaxID=1869338 RepID=UPI002B45EBF4|nr:hypothetical protein [Dyella sp.]
MHILCINAHLNPQHFHPNNYNHVYPYAVGSTPGTLTTAHAGHDGWYGGVGTGWNDQGGISLLS